MKIEVTFEKAVKKQFKEECIKRLKKFISQIKLEQQKWKQGECSLRKYIECNEDSHRSLAITKNQENKKSQKMLKPTLDVHFIEPLMMKEQKYEPKIAKQTKCLSGNSSTPSINGLSIQQIQKNLDTAMLRIQQTARKQSTNHHQLKQQLQQTNKKVDMILFHFDNHDLVESEVKLPSFQTEQLLLSNNNHLDFQAKFNQLAGRYDQLKSTSRVLKKGFKGGHSMYSFESTGDSVTFRNF